MKLSKINISRMNIKNLVHYILFKQSPVSLMRLFLFEGESVKLYIRGIKYLYCIEFGQHHGFKELKI